MSKISGKFFWLIVLTCLVFTGLYLYSYQLSYQKPYDHKYSRDLFDHSQWRIPNSDRGIGDELLYQVASYELLNTWQYFDINPEVPPLGKYLYGSSIRLFGNALWINLPVFWAALFFFYLISRSFLKSDRKTYFALVLFLLQAVIFGQLNTTMFDLPQLLALLIHVFSIQKILSSKKTDWRYTLLAGLSAGAFVSLKIGYLILFIFLADGILLLREKKWRTGFLIGMLAVLVYPLTYLPHFLQGNTPLDFVRSQLWILHFYADSKVPVDRILMPITFLTGWYRGWSEGATWNHSEQWSLSWPILLILWGVTLVRQKMEKAKWDPFSLYLNLLFISLIIGLWLIPFWVRYLILVIPFLILLGVNQLNTARPFWITVITLMCLIQLPFALIPRPQPIVEHLTNLWEKESYLDLYTYLSFPKNQPERFRFAKKQTQLQTKAKYETREISSKLGPHNLLTNRIPLEITVDYRFRKKQKRVTKTTALIREKNQWFVEWNPQLNSLATGN